MALNSNPGTFFPGVGRGIGVDEHGGLPGANKAVECALPEHVVRRDHHEQVLITKELPRRSKRGAVAELPLTCQYGMHLAGAQPGYDRPNRPGVVADNDENLTDADIKESANGSLDELQTTQLDERLRTPPGDCPESFRASGRQHHTHSWLDPGRRQRRGPEVMRL